MMFVPGVACGGPVFETCMSAIGVRVTVLVAVLFVASGSVTPAGTATVAVLVRTPVTPEASVPLTVNVA